MSGRHRLLGEGSATDPFPDRINVVADTPRAREPHLITVEAANDMAASFYHMGYHRGQREKLDRLHDHFDTNQRYSGDYIRRQIRELRDES